MKQQLPKLVFIAAAVAHPGLPQSASPLTPATGAISSTVLEGYADIHVHQMGQLGFGASILIGDERGAAENALLPVPPNMRRGHDTAELAGRGKIAAAIVNTLTFDFFRHGEDGYPKFKSWPGTERWTHQQVYKNWLFRAYQGGMRVMVMLAVNSEDMFGRGENEIPLLSHHRFQRVIRPGRTGNDMEALDWQIREAYRLETEIDTGAGGPGRGWYRIVRDPAEAEEVIQSGKLAVILGTELQHLFNCDADRPHCSHADITEGLNRLEALGVNYVFPVHHKLNQFGGPAKFVVLNNGPSEVCPEYSHRCSAIGLTDSGKFLVEELMARGMLVDTDHLSAKAFQDIMSIAEGRKYPVFASHVIPYELGTEKNEKSKTELARRNVDILRILRLGGVVAPMLGTPTGEYSGPAVKVCAPSDTGSADQWANAYLLLRDLARQAGAADSAGRVAVGTDFNGFAGWPAPHASCGSHPEYRVQYPFQLPEGLIRAPGQTDSEMGLFRFPPLGTPSNFYDKGVAHAGMLPDFFEQVRRILRHDTLNEPFYRSAEGVVKVWAAIRARSDGWIRGPVRWIPQHPFDVFTDAINISARYERPTEGGEAICRTRTDHKLGLREGDECRLVEAPDVVFNEPGQIAAYHSGRCLTVANYRDSEIAVQQPCTKASNQFWHLSDESGNTPRRIINAMTGKCLTAVLSRSTRAGAIVQMSCDQHNNGQLWRAHRAGNTFELIAHTGLCAEVANQSRSNGAALRQNACNGASNQLWSIDSMRHSDYELLYQADLNKLRWTSFPQTDEHAVEVRDGTAICRATGSHWLGVVRGNQCVARRGNSEIFAASVYDSLYQKLGTEPVSYGH